jgi:hypothetical protein
MGLWEYQLQPLTIEWLRAVVAGLPDGTPVEVEFDDGMESRPLRPMHIDLKGAAGKPIAFVITVV